MKYCKKVVDAILQSIANGQAQVAACKANDISYVQFWQWQQRDPELKDRINSALDKRAVVIEDVFYKRLESGTAQPSEYMFYLKNRLPDRWKNDDFNFNPSIHYHYTKINDEKVIEQARERGLQLPDEIKRRLNENLHI